MQLDQDHAPHQPTHEEDDAWVLETRGLDAGAGVIEDVRIGSGLHQILTGRESHATTLALTLSGRMKPRTGYVAMGEENTPRGIAKQVALAGATELDGLERLVKLGQVIREQYAWGNPWWRRVPAAEDIMATEVWTAWAEPLGLMLDPKHRIGDLDVVDRLLLRVVLAGIARPDARLLLVDDIDQIRDIEARHEALLALARLSEKIPTVVMSVNHFDQDPFDACHRVRLATPQDPAPVAAEAEGPGGTGPEEHSFNQPEGGSN